MPLDTGRHPVQDTKVMSNAIQSSLAKRSRWLSALRRPNHHIQETESFRVNSYEHGSGLGLQGTLAAALSFGFRGQGPHAQDMVVLTERTTHQGFGAPVSRRNGT